MEIKKEEYKNYLEGQFLNMREAAEMLDVSEEEMKALIQQHKVPTHNVAGVFLRLKKEDVEHLKNRWRIDRELFPAPEPYFSHHDTVQKPTAREKWQDFWYFNDFYIICSVLIVVLLYFIISSQ